MARERAQLRSRLIDVPSELTRVGTDIVIILINSEVFRQRSQEILDRVSAARQIHRTESGGRTALAMSDGSDSVATLPEANRLTMEATAYAFQYGYETTITLDLISENLANDAIEISASMLRLLETTIREGEVAEHYSNLRRWYRAGVINSDAPVSQGTAPQVQAGRFAATTDGAYYEGKNRELKDTAYGGYDMVEVITSNPYVPFDAILKTITAVNATNEHPERAVMVYEIMNTDRDFFRLMGTGIEGVHYEDRGNNFIEPIANSGYPGGWNWAWGDLDRNGYQIFGTPPGMLDAKVAGVTAADPSPILGTI